MNISQLAREICRREGKTQQVNIAQVREILGVISDICAEDLVAIDVLVRNGLKRYKNTFTVSKKNQPIMKRSTRSTKKTKKLKN